MSEVWQCAHGYRNGCCPSPNELSGLHERIESLETELSKSGELIRKQGRELGEQDVKIAALESANKALREALERIKIRTFRDAEGPELRAQNENNYRDAVKALAASPGEPTPISHWADCSVHNEPAYPNGPCDCGGYDPSTPEGEKE